MKSETKKILLCSEKMPTCVADIFEGLSYSVERIPRCDSLSTEVDHHADMLFSVMSDGSLITDRGYIEANAAFFDALRKKGVKISASEKSLSPKYPYDILFDAIKIEMVTKECGVSAENESASGGKGCLLIGKLRYAAPELLAEATKAVNVGQGYALCSTLLMKGAAVCADVGICRALSENGYDVLKIEAGGIELPGYGYGFIGGASAVLEDIKTVVFFGNVRAHGNGEAIVGFCEKHGYKVYFAKELPLTDFGGVKAL